MDAFWKPIWPEWTAEKRIGQGSCGTVYKARRDDGKTAAIKVIRIPRSETETEALHADGMSAEEIRRYYDARTEELLAEVRCVRSLPDHPNIVRVEDHAVLPDESGTGSRLFIRMELLTPLVSWLADKTLTQEDVIRLGGDICRALSACHGIRLLHRDVKPENIFVDSAGHFKLGDFGIARRMEHPGTYLTSVGTPMYIAPEVAAGRSYDERADIYSLGLILYRFLNRNRLPFMNDQRLTSPSDRRHALEWRLKGEALPAPADASPALAAVILKACAFQPEDRYASAEAFRKALEGEDAGTDRNRKPLLFLAGGAALLLAVLGLLLLPKFSKELSESSSAGSVLSSEAGSTPSVPSAIQTESEPSRTAAPSAETSPEEATSEAETSAEPVTWPADYSEDNAQFCQFSLSPDGTYQTLTDLIETVFSADLALPDLVQGLPVKAISTIALEHLYISRGNLYLPKPLASLEPYSVSNCTVEGNVIVYGDVKQIGTRAFYQSYFETLEICEGCETILDRAFDETTADRLIIPSSVKSMDNALCTTSRIGTLEVHSQAVLDEWLTGEDQLLFTVREFVLGPEIKDYTVENGCLIHIPSRTLFRTCETFEIPEDGSVERIAPYAIYRVWNEAWSGVQLRIPEGVRAIDDRAIYLEVPGVPLNRETPALVSLPASLEEIHPYSFSSTCIASWPGTRAEWIAFTARYTDPAGQAFFGASGTFWVYCTDGKLTADRKDDGTPYWRPLYDP